MTKNNFIPSTVFIEKLPDICVDLQLVSIYDMDCYSVPQLLYRLAQKINDTITNMEHNDTALKAQLDDLQVKLEYLLGEGLTTELQKIFEKMYADGTLQSLVEASMVDINRRLDKLETDVTSINSQLDHTMNYINAASYAKNKNISVNKAINELIQLNINCYVPNIEVEITESIVFNTNLYSFVCNGILKVVDDIDCCIIDCTRSDIYIKKIIYNDLNKKGNAVKFQPITNKMSSYNNVHVSVIDDSLRCFYLYANETKGCQYNKISFNIVKGDRVIELGTGCDGGPWVNENTFNCGQMCGGIGVYARKTNTQADMYNGNKFLNGGFEGIDKICDVEHFKLNYFENFRMEESIYGETWIDLKHSYANEFITSSKIPFAKVKVDELTCHSIFIESFEGFRNGSNVYQANKICFGSNYKIMVRDKPQSIIVYNNQDCTPILTNEDSDYAYGSLVRVKTTQGNHKKIIINDRYRDLKFRNIDFILELEMGPYSSITIMSGDKEIKKFEGETTGTIKGVYKIFINTQDGSAKKMNIIQLNTTYEEYTI